MGIFIYVVLHYKRFDCNMVIKTTEELTEDFSKIKKEYEKAKAELKELNLARKCLKCGCLLSIKLNWYESSKKIYRYVCKSCENNISRNWVTNNKERHIHNHKHYCENNKEKIKENSSKWVKNNRIKVNENNRKRNKTIKIDILSHYSENEKIECKCCKESHIEFLTIDHINNDGAKHRKENNITTPRRFYRWLQKNNYPDGFRILCFNCNIAKGFYGSCPHERE